MDSPKFTRSSSSEVRVRFAPSPTGPFSIGNARTALFNWLFAKHGNGVFFLRIEDTDKERSKKSYEKEILEGLKWLGIEWDDKPIRQSERLEIYQNYLQKLLEERRAYWCFCTPEELETERQAQLSQGIAPKYSGRCRNFAPEEVEKQLKDGKPAVIRFKVAEKKVTVNDLVRGQVQFEAALLGDIIIAKGLQEPLYNFAAAIDDVLMEITHVIRGEDHLSNTPKQILIQESLGFTSPRFAHLPLILGPNRKKLSKRYSAKSLNDYRQEGYLPEAMLNFLVLLGWHPIEDREVISREDMIKEFSLERAQKGGAVFNEEKLNWLNSHYIKEKSQEALLENLEPFVPSTWLTKKKMLLKIVKIEKERMKTLKDFSNLAKFFFELPDYDKKMLIWKETSSEIILNNLKKIRDLIKNSDPEEGFLSKVFFEKILALAETLGRGEVLWPLRVALSGQMASPGPLEILEVLGKTESLKRINLAIKKLETNV